LAADILLDAWRDALGEVLVQERRQWERERALIEAQAHGAVNKMRAEIATLRGDVMELVRARLLEVKDGKNGEAGPPGATGEKGAQGEQGIQGEAGGRGEPGAAGPVGAAGEPGPVGAAGPAGPTGEPGAAGPAGESGPAGPIGAAGADGGAGPRGDAGIAGQKGDPGVRGEPGPTGARGERGFPGERGEPGLIGKMGPAGPPGQGGAKGEQGPIGERGPTGLLPVAKLHEPGTVSYAAQVVVHGGGLWQAQKDTGQSPPHADWVCLARGGRDGVSPTVRGTYQDGDKYRALDIVAFNKGSFIARQDDPGPCPGDGWQLLTAHGSRGGQGGKGSRGEKGERGDPGPSIERWLIDRRSYTATPVLTDGSEGAEINLRDLFEQYQTDAG
jgi:hypothetical protein